MLKGKVRKRRSECGETCDSCVNTRIEKEKIGKREGSCVFAGHVGNSSFRCGGAKCRLHLCEVVFS